MKRLLVVSLVLVVGSWAAGIASAAPAGSPATVTLSQALAGTSYLDSAQTPMMVAANHRRIRRHRRRVRRRIRRRYRVRYCRRRYRHCARWGGWRRPCRLWRHGRCVRRWHRRRHCRHWVWRCRNYGYRWRYR